jgi:protein gp37
MSDTSMIEWTDATWNPTVGCTHLSPGCDHCYAARLASGRLRHQPAYTGLAEGGRFNGTVRTLPDRLDAPLHWHKPRRVVHKKVAGRELDGRTWDEQPPRRTRDDFRR